MGFIPIVAFCALMGGEPDMERCVFADDLTYAFSTETACAIQANRMKDDPNTLQTTANMLFAEYGYIGRQGYSLWCIPEDEVQEFYNNVGVGFQGDIPNDA